MSIDSLVARQAGVISRSQALAAGLSRDAVDHRVRTRHWRPLHPRVYLAAGHPIDDEVRVRGALLWAGDGAVLSGLAAAWWHGLVTAPPPVVAVTVAHRQRPRSRPGISVRRRDLAAADRTTHRGVPVTALPLTALDAAVQLGARGGELLDRALQHRVRFPDLYAAHCRYLGAPGSATASRLIVAAVDRSASVAGRELVRLVRASAVTGWRCAFPIGDHVADLAFPAARVAIEVDGWARHPDAVRARADERRRNTLARAGWTVLRYTWHDLVERPRAVLAGVVSEVHRGMREPAHEVSLPSPLTGPTRRPGYPES